MTNALGRRTALLAAAAGLGAIGAWAQDAVPVVETRSGKVRGTAVGGAQGFKGIPYAAFTAGSARFLPPSPPAPWLGIRNAAAFGVSAPQLPARRV